MSTVYFPSFCCSECCNVPTTRMHYLSITAMGSSPTIRTAIPPLYPGQTWHWPSPPGQHTPSGLSWVIISLPSLSLNGGCWESSTCDFCGSTFTKRESCIISSLSSGMTGSWTWIIVNVADKSLAGERGWQDDSRIFLCYRNYSKPTWKAKVGVCVIHLRGPGTPEIFKQTNTQAQ